jgi:Fur family ferric uptake transcriptional regulator
MRQTVQRREILDVLCSSDDHPTASAVYERVRARLPRISLGTVYRNLDRLAECGEIARIEVPGREMRFDADTEQHYHLRCTGCGRVVDVDREDVTVDVRHPDIVDGVRITDCRIQFLGRCERCSASC